MDRVVTVRDGRVVRDRDKVSAYDVRTAAVTRSERDPVGATVRAAAPEVGP